MVEPGLIFGVFDSALKTLGLIREGKKQRNEKIDQALFALYAALRETRDYVYGLKRGNRRNHRRELNLALLWENASVPIRYIDKNLANRCCEKGNYWLDPEAWTERDIVNRGIELDAMYRATREILLHS